VSHLGPRADELAVRYERATAITHLTWAVVIGRVTSAGPKLKYDERANPTCTFGLDVEESGKEGQIRHSYIPVEGLGKLAESVTGRGPTPREIRDQRLRHLTAETLQRDV
jgi:hypothetical protein